MDEAVREKLLSRLMSKISRDETTGCWNWTGALSRGYGLLSSRFGKSPHKAHRLSYELHKGQIPEGMVVRHTCDNTRCCNPDHLVIGTQRDNANDMASRGRMNRESLMNLRPGKAGYHGAGPLSKKELLNGVCK